MTDCTRFIVPLSAPDCDAAVTQARAALTQGAQMLELRVDYLSSLQPRMIPGLIERIRQLPAGDIPLVVTCRDRQEGGVHAYPLSLRAGVLAEAVKQGADYVDIELRNLAQARGMDVFASALRSQEQRLIVSAHSFTGPFADLHGLYDQIKAAAPRSIPKLVYTASHINDCFDAFDLLYQTKGLRTVFCMGPAGLISRILAMKFQSFCTFASLDDQCATAPGQPTLRHMRQDCRGDIIDEHTEVYGIIADPVGHSLSPALHNACFGDLGMNRLYLPLWIQDGMVGLSTFLDKVRARPWLGFRGFSVTIPHKQNAIDYVKQHKGIVEPLAEKIGAANTLLCDPKGPLQAFNTDYTGAMQAITTTLGIAVSQLRNWPVAVVGAGGVARALVAGLTDAGARVTIYNRTKSKAEALARQFACHYAGLEGLADLDARLLVNCTSIGMFPDVDRSPVPAEILHRNMAVFDTVYNPVQTRLLQDARQRGALCIDGISMFVYQAMEQFRLFTGVQPNEEIIRKTVCNRLEVSPSS